MNMQSLRRWVVWMGLGGAATVGGAEVVAPVPASTASSVALPSSNPLILAPLVQVQRPSGRLTARQIGVVINDNDPYSVAVGGYYIKRRGLGTQQVLRLRLPVTPRLSPEEFAALDEKIRLFFGPNIQALALAWRQPWAVGCNAITAAVSLGFQPAQCSNTCARGKPSPYFNHSTALPFRSLRVRPSMLLAADDETAARALIDRGVQADRWLRQRFAPASRAVFEYTSDKARNVRSRLYPRPTQAGGRLEIRLEADAVQPRDLEEKLLLYHTGRVRVEHLESFHFVPGAVADHLTSYGGVLDGSTGQMPITAWIAAGATASHGTVSEPCNHLEKFPHPQILLFNLLAGSTVLEAYWKSVAWPAQSLFIGEPLAAPMAKR